MEKLSKIDKITLVASIPAMVIDKMLMSGEMYLFGDWKDGVIGLILMIITIPDFLRVLKLYFTGKEN